MRELTSESPIDSCQEELSPSDPIESVCLLFQPPSLLLSVTSATTDQRPYTHFRFRSRSDSIRPRVKTTRLRSSVLDMYGCLKFSAQLRKLKCNGFLFIAVTLCFQFRKPNCQTSDLHLDHFPKQTFAFSTNFRILERNNVMYSLSDNKELLLNLQ